MKLQRYQITHVPGPDKSGSYIIWDMAVKKKRIDRFTYKNELDRGKAYTLARIEMREFNEACNVS